MYVKTSADDCCPTGFSLLSNLASPRKSRWARFAAMAGALLAALLVTASASAATQTVNSLADTNDGSCGTTCTLRDAITAAAAGDTISFSVTGTITLTSALPLIGKNLTIAGPGANKLTISGNKSTAVGSVFGVAGSATTVTISGLTIANANTTGNGAAILNSQGTLTVSDCVFSGNNSSAYGGGILSSGKLTVSGSTFLNNSANYGGAIANIGTTVTVYNDTFYGNTATNQGGAIISTGGTLTVADNTFVENSSPIGGAVAVTSGSLNVTNNIFSRNLTNDATGSVNSAGTLSKEENNLFWFNTGGDASFSPAGTDVTTRDPMLLPLGYYGGPTETMLPLSGSPAIGAGSSADVPSGVTTDQRGFALGSTVDAGAVQTNYVTASSPLPASYSGLEDVDLTGLSGSVSSPDIAITSGQVNLIGPGANKLTLSGGGSTRVLSVNSGAQAFLYGVTISNGSTSSSDGAGINNAGTLTLLESAVAGNTANNAADGGGGIYSTGALMVMDSTISGNTESNGPAGGGGILNNGGTLAVVGSTIAGNTASGLPGAGGGIDNSGPLTVTDSTISGNTGSTGGGISLGAGTATLANSIVAGNTAGGNADINGTPTSTGGNQIGTSVSLAPLGNYGGPTQTMLPLPATGGNPAICGGVKSLAVDQYGNALTTDQRGFSIGASSYCTGTQVDAGAVQTDYTAIQFTNINGDYAELAGGTPVTAPIVSVTENGQNIGGVPVTLTYGGGGTVTGASATTVAGTGATFSAFSVNTAGSGALSSTLQLTSLASISTASPGPTLDVEAPIAVTPATSALSAGMVGQAYSVTFVATGGTSSSPQFTYSVSSGTLPPGLALASTSGVLSGTPTAEQSTPYSFTIQAKDKNKFTGSTSYTLQVNQATTAITLSSADTTTTTEPSGASFVNDSVTFTASLTPAGPNVVFAKQVSFTIDGASVGACAAQPVTVATSGSTTTATATCTVSNLALGTHNISASYPSGDSNYSAASGGPFVQTVSLRGTTVSVQSSGSPSNVDGSVTFTATISSSSGTPSGGTVAFSSDGVGISNCGSVALTVASGKATAQCPISSLTATSSTPHTIQAAYTGDGTTYAAGSGTTTQTVNQAATSTSVSSSGAIAVNQPVTLTASVTPNSPVGLSGGTVEFLDGKTPIGGCQAQPINVPQSGEAQCTTTFTSSAKHPITAIYSGDSNYSLTAAANATALNQGVSQAASSVSFLATTPTTVDQPATFTVSVVPYSGTTPQTPPYTGAPVSGSVTFTSNGTTLCAAATVALNGQLYEATCSTSSLPAGSPSVVATYSGDANYNGSNNNTTQTVSQAATKVVVSSAGATTVNQPVTLTAAVTPDSPVALSSSGTVAFSDGGTAIASCATQPINTSTGQATCSATFQTTGSHTISAVYNGDSNYAATLAANVTPAAQTVNTAATAVTVTSSGGSSVNQQVTFTAAITPYNGTTPLSSPFTGAAAVTGSVTFSYKGTAICTGAPVTFASGNYQATCSTTSLPNGSPVVSATYSGDSNYSGSSGQVTQKVSPGATSVVVTSSPNPSVVLNPQNSGDAVNLMATVSPSSGAVALSGSVTFTDNGAPIAECQAAVPVNTSTGVASCVTKSLVAGTHTILAVYNSDPNYTTSSGSLTQQVEDYSLSTSTTSEITVSQGYTNTTDPFSPQSITVSATPIAGFTGNLTLSCNVVAVTVPTGAVTPTCSLGSTTLAIASGATSQAVALTVDAGSGSNQRATPGTYSVSITGVDSATGLTRITAAVPVLVRSLAGPLTVVSGATTGNIVPVSFTLPANVGLSSIECVSVSGPTLTSSVAPVALGIGCSFNPSTVAATGTIQGVPVTVTITTGGTTTAMLGDSNTAVFAASMIGLPILLLLGFMPGGKSSRKVLYRYLGLACMLVLLLQGTGCSGGHFTAPPSTSGTTPPGSYNILVQGQGTDNQTYQAVIQLNVTR